jgi:hypothetical protein
MAIEAAKKDGMSKFGGKIPANLKTPLRDGDIDRPDDPAYENSYFINTNSSSVNFLRVLPSTNLNPSHSLPSLIARAVA